MSHPKIGYACINITLAEQDVTVNRTARVATIETRGIDHIRDLILKNLRDCLRVLQWNEEHGIRFYRMSSGMISHIGNDRLAIPGATHDIDFARPLLSQIGDFARSHGHRLSFHVGQYTLLSSNDPAIIARSIADLAAHVDVLDAIDAHVAVPQIHRKVADRWFMAPQGVIILHGGGIYGDKPAAIETIRANIRNLDPRIKRRIVLENDERSYCPDDLLPICEEFGIPFCLDVFHYKCYREKDPSMPSYSTMLNDDTLWKRIRDTWGCGCDCNGFAPSDITEIKSQCGSKCRSGGCGANACSRCAKCVSADGVGSDDTTAVCKCRRMKIHISSQKIADDDPTVRIPLGAHADYIKPDEIDLAGVWRQCSKFGADIMVEAKAKELACQRVKEFVSSMEGKK